MRIDFYLYLCITIQNQQTMDTSIKIKQGIGDLKFNMPVEDVVALWGLADEVENIYNAADEPTTVLHYNTLSTTLFFEGENPKLLCIDTSNDECTLFEKDVFDLDERTIVQLMVAHDFTEQDADDEDWGERRISFPQANIDFYFDEGELTSIVWGA